EGRVNCARGLAEPYKPGETERLMDTLANIQRTLDTIDRAIADEERAKRSDVNSALHPVIQQLERAAGLHRNDSSDGPSLPICRHRDRSQQPPSRSARQSR